MTDAGHPRGPARGPSGAGVGVVADWMSHRPVSVSLDASVRHVIRIMADNGIRHVLVTDDGRLVGIVSNRDVRSLPVEGERPAAPDLAIGRLMTESPVTVSPEVSLIEAARAMLESKIGALPVLDRGRIVGILTKSDALEALLAWASRGHEPPEGAGAARDL